MKHDNCLVDMNRNEVSLTIGQEKSAEDISTTSELLSLLYSNEGMTETEIYSTFHAISNRLSSVLADVEEATNSMNRLNETLSLMLSRFWQAIQPLVWRRQPEDDVSEYLNALEALRANQNSDRLGSPYDSLISLVQHATGIEDESERAEFIEAKTSGFIEAYGNGGIKALSNVILSETNEEIASEILANVARFDDKKTERYRTWLLSRCLSSPSPYLRYEATSGLLSMGATDSATAIKRAAEQEESDILRKKMFRVANKLEEQSGGAPHTSY